MTMNNTEQSKASSKQHRATTEQWRQLQVLDRRVVTFVDLKDLLLFRSIILELRDRLAVAELRAAEALVYFARYPACPSCSSSHTRVIETRVLHNGGRRRRHLCYACKHRWTTWHGERLRPGRMPHAQGANGNKPPLTEDKVRLIFTSEISAIKLGRQLSCHDCQHWRGKSCGMGFPDPVEEGPKFAVDCSLYEPSQSMSRA